MGLFETQPAPLPTSNTGIGQVSFINPGTGNAAVLGSGGTWFYFVICFVAATGILATTPASGVAAGGSTIGAAGAGNSWYGFAWRVT